jgi:hypothetical protein
VIELRKPWLSLAALLFAAVSAFADNTVTLGTVPLVRGSTTLFTHPDVAACLEDIRTRAITSQTAYQCRLNATAVPIVAPPAPTVNLAASPSTVQPGQTSTLNWSSTNATSCTAGGSWGGSKATSGSEATSALTATSTFSLSCTGSSGSGNASTTVTVAAAGSVTGLDFPSNGQTAQDIRLRFTGAALQPIYPATYIWRINPRQQSSYHTTFFWGTEGSNFWWNSGSPDSYYGAHPYPYSSQKRWEIAGGPGWDVHSEASTITQWDRWYTQAMVVWSDASGKHHDFYWDLPDTSKKLTLNAPASFGNTMPPQPALTWGDAPWSVGNERLSGILRGLQLYNAPLTISDVLAEVSAPLSTTSGAANVWYLNLNPTPDDVTDKSGKGHHPSWSSSARPGLWQQ